jgi:hypothetical protein
MRHLSAHQLATFEKKCRKWREMHAGQASIGITEKSIRCQNVAQPIATAASFD